MAKETNSEKVNMKTLARALNLSTATVSKALSDSHEISMETKQRVLETATRLNYVPNHFASSLRKRQSSTIAVVLPEIADSFFSQAINGIENVVAKHNYHTLIYLTHDNYEREVHMFNELSGGRVDGVLVSVASGTKDTSHIKTLQKAGIPVVIFDRVCDDVSADQIKTDDLHSAFMATGHLIDQGCKNISLVTIDGYPSIFLAREEGYKKALQARGMSINEHNILTCSNLHIQQNMADLVQHIEQHKPDGILATVEHLATTTYLACEDMKLKIPGDIKVVCFTNQITAPILNPPLTTIFQPAYGMGKQAAELLFNHFSGKFVQGKTENIVLPSQLIERASTVNG